MHLFKSFGDGVGTAAGVAWPTFGILSGTLGLGIGGAATLILGSVATVLFFSVALPVAYLSYSNHQKEKRELIRAIESRVNKLTEDLHTYLNILLQEYLFQYNIESTTHLSRSLLIEHLKATIWKDVTTQHFNHFTITTSVLKNLLSESHPLLPGLVDRVLSERRAPAHYQLNVPNNVQSKQDLHHLIQNEGRRNVEKKSQNANGMYIKSALIGFVAAFGSIAGCTCGTLGLLSSLGLFAGLAAVPIVGWMTLGCAIAFGLTISAVCIYTAYQKNKREELNYYYEKMEQEMHVLNTMKTYKLDTLKEARSHSKPINTSVPVSELTKSQACKRRPYSTHGSDTVNHIFWMEKDRFKKDISSQKAPRKFALM